VLDINQIKEILPHRYPFLLLDTVVELEEGKRCWARKCVTGNEAFFEGHFPDYPVMPGVLIVEALAQAGAVSVLSLPENKGKLAFFASIKEAKFKRQVVPGDVLELEATMVKMRGSSGIGECVARVDGEIACECTVMFMFGN